MPVEVKRIPRILELVAQIGKAAGFEQPAFLKRKVEGEWVILQTQEQLLAYGDPYRRHNLNNFGSYVVAPADINQYAAACFSISHFPGSCACAVAHGASVTYENKGIFKLTLDLIVEIAGFGGYSAVMGSDIVRNAPSMKALEGKAFKPVFEVVNKRTNNNCRFFFKEIPRA